MPTKPPDGLATSAPTRDEGGRPPETKADSSAPDGPTSPGHSAAQDAATRASATEEDASDALNKDPAGPETDDATAHVAHDPDADDETAGVTSVGMAHDAMFKALFGDRDQAAAALRALLPDDVAACIDFDTLNLEHGSMVTKDLRQRHGDLLYSAKLRQPSDPHKLSSSQPGPEEAESRPEGAAGPTEPRPEGAPSPTEPRPEGAAGPAEPRPEKDRILLSILLEHQSTVAPDMAWRATEKAVYHMAQWRKLHGGQRVPPVLSVVVYNGTTAWTAPKNVIDLMGLSPATKAVLGKYLLSFGYLLDDLHRASHAEVAARAVGPVMRLGLVAMKYSRSTELIDHLAAQADDIRALLATEPGRDAWFLLMHYILVTNPTLDRDRAADRLASAVGPEVETNMLTYGQRLEKEIYDRIADKARADGLQQGRAEALKEGRAEALKEARAEVLKEQRAVMLDQLTIRFGDLPEAVVQRVNAAKPDELRLWARRFVTAAALDDVFVPSR